MLGTHIGRQILLRAQPWTPLQLGPYLVAWYDFTDPASMTITAGNVVTAIRDKSFSRKDLTASASPVFKPIGWTDGSSCVEMTTTQYFGHTSFGIASGTRIQVHASVILETDTAGDTRMVAMAQNGQEDYASGTVYLDDFFSKMGSYWNGGDGAYTAIGNITKGAPLVTSTTHDGTTQRFHYNGTIGENTVTAAYPAFAGDVFAINNFISNSGLQTGSYGPHARYKEVIVTNVQVPTTAYRQLVEGYLASRAAVVLASGHPWRSVAPTRNVSIV